MNHVRTVVLATVLAFALAACSTADEVGGADREPEVAITHLADGQVVGPEHVVVLNVSAHRLADLSVGIDDASPEALTPQGRTEFELPDLTAGSHTLLATATDDRGRTASASVDFVYDPTAAPPSDAVDDGSDDPAPPADGAVAGDLRISWLQPSSTRRVAGDVALSAEAEGSHGGLRISLWYQAAEGDPQPIAAADGTELATTWSTLGVEPGPYVLIAQVRDSDGHVATSEIVVNVESEIVIMNPLDEDTVGPAEDRRQVDVTVGLAGTFQSASDIREVEILIGATADGRMAATETDTEGGATFVYAWDTCEASAGHDVDVIGDRTLTARVTFDDGRTLLSPGVQVGFMGGCP